ncbi:MAG: 6-carboxytetrahydropterin synthase [Euryarchaeota archaeon]|jgi:6-pyruvoyltetrahydropterin/6-carboxytetrahydropterin synthase|uniref:6-carboxytetrahydropterin synthase n=1 Tax=Methanobacterium sp. MZD130B TaxID=3394378 RepID=UPI00175FAFB6|nr:6-carboxytetrahydropterin synthase [Euryarchaeota archaeon]HHT18445.1 6-carboxytetrahydropterin synthase QueD [Methanobacterium sp.]
MKIVINGIHANLRFASAHMIPCHEFCGGIHGHSYHVDVTVEGERGGEFGFVVDFKTVKGRVREICKKLDHKLLVPENSKEIEFKNIDKYVEFSIKDKEYKIPREDCCLLPLPSTSAEALSEYFVEKLFQALSREGADIQAMEICVNEGIGQGACFEKIVK